MLLYIFRSENSGKFTPCFCGNYALFNQPPCTFRKKYQYLGVASSHEPHCNTNDVSKEFISSWSWLPCNWGQPQNLRKKKDILLTLRGSWLIQGGIVYVWNVYIIHKLQYSAQCCLRRSLFDTPALHTQYTQIRPHWNPSPSALRCKPLHGLYRPIALPGNVLNIEAWSSTPYPNFYPANSWTEPQALAKRNSVRELPWSA